ncbi:MAG: protein-L-isoaspartate O-methyltransferase [Burkholderiaceae bacterium]
MNLEQARFNMIEQQIRPWDVLDSHILHLLSVVKREDFVPAAQKALAFVDIEIKLPCGQFMLEPRVEARLLQDLAVQHHEKVLEIGTGSGYMAALLAHRCQRVISLELEPELAELARKQLHQAGIHNVEVRLADGSGGAPSDGLFDVILLSGSVAEIPPILLAQLKVGGRLGAIVGQDPMMQATFVTRTGAAEFQTKRPWDTVAPRLRHFPEPAHFSF